MRFQVLRRCCRVWLVWYPAEWTTGDVQLRILHILRDCVNVVLGRVRARVVWLLLVCVCARCFEYRPNANCDGSRLRRPLLRYILLLPAM